jgi:hypothetical protein
MNLDRSGLKYPGPFKILPSSRRIGVSKPETPPNTQSRGSFVSSLNPKFFKVIQTISAAVAIVAFIPDLAAYLEIGLPEWVTVLNDKAVKIGSLTAIILAQLPNEAKK